MVEQRKRVLITGITGFVGSWCTKLFIENGSFIVRGTVRDKNNMKKIQPLIDEFGEEAWSKVELYEADLTNEQSIIDACEGVDILIHTASPYPISKPKNPDQLIKPAVNGTLAAMRGAEKHGVKRVVVTSSFAAIMNSKEKHDVFNEDIWSDEKEGGPYPISKTLAEKAAWDFVEKQEEGKKIELVVINPAMILGPAFINTDFSSGQLIKQLLQGEMGGVPRIQFPMVDVRDVAKAHLEAAIRPEAAGKRFLLAREGIWFQEIAEILAEEYGKTYGTKTNQLPRWLIKIVSWFDSQAKTVIEYWDRPLMVDNSRSKDVLGIEYIEPKEQVLTMASSLIKYGIVKEKKACKVTGKK